VPPAKLRFYPEYQRESGSAGAEEVLQVLSGPHAAPSDQI